jgi:hypothetical protein
MRLAWATRQDLGGRGHAEIEPYNAALGHRGKGRAGAIRRFPKPVSRCIDRRSRRFASRCIRWGRRQDLWGEAARRVPWQRIILDRYIFLRWTDGEEIRLQKKGSGGETDVDESGIGPAQPKEPYPIGSASGERAVVGWPAGDASRGAAAGYGERPLLALRTRGRQPQRGIRPPRHFANHAGGTSLVYGYSQHHPGAHGPRDHRVSRVPRQVLPYMSSLTSVTDVDIRRSYYQQTCQLKAILYNSLIH